MTSFEFIDLLRALMATPLAGWLRPWRRPAFGGAAIPRTNAAVIYRMAFGWAALTIAMFLSTRRMDLQMSFPAATWLRIAQWTEPRS